MTNEQAIDHIKHHNEAHRLSERGAVLITEALDMAIDALKREHDYQTLLHDMLLEFQNTKCVIENYDRTLRTVVHDCGLNEVALELPTGQSYVDYVRCKLMELVNRYDAILHNGKEIK